MSNQATCCRQLLSDELCLLKAMYSAGEMEVNEAENLLQCGGVTQIVLRQNVGTINYEVVVQLSSEYPIFLKPTAFVRSSSVRCDELNQELRCFIENESLGVPLTLSIFQWIKDCIHHYQGSTSKQTAEAVGNAKVTAGSEMKWARFWIYSHHIRSQVKRRKIEDSAVANDLKGFFCVGKPGVIVVEGLKEDCDDFWDEIRFLGWQRIVLRHYEYLNNPSLFRFGKFQEVIIPRVDYLSMLKKMLVDVDLEYGFSLLLGL